MFKKILLASDGSGHALRAAHTAVKLAGYDKGGEVTIIYAINGSASKSDVLTEGDPHERVNRRKERLKKTEGVLQERGVQYEIRIVKGDPGPTIVQYANDHSYDVVVIGSRGLNGLQEMVLGSVSHKVAKRANCPVMIVK
ncbi:universal stress protein [Halobacillus seohaensis]|uniref:Universal stress protein n=1 Tax=Halobacillus seohaensis TaxID=447421 RepID=A0ABW2EN94_9BACI